MSWAALDALFDAVPGVWSACVCAIDGTVRWGYGPNFVQPAASLIKVPLALTVVDLLGERLGESVEIRAADRVEGTGPLDLQPGAPHEIPASLPIRDLLAYALTHSDNTAANLLIDCVGMEAVNRWLTAIGPRTRLRRKFMDYAARTAGRDNTTTAADMCTILRHAMQPRYAQLLGWLAEAVGDGKLEAGLPHGTRIAHKVGDLPDVEHDAGIVFAPKGVYIAAVLSAALHDTMAARRTIARASRLIWTIMTMNDEGVNAHNQL